MSVRRNSCSLIAVFEANGDAERSHLRITPMGTLKPTWLTFSDFTQLSSPHDIAGKKVLVVNIAGFLDFNTKFVADSFEKCGAECRILHQSSRTGKIAD